MTPAQCLSTIRDQVVETSANFWTDAEIYRYMWSGESILNAQLGLYEANGTQNTFTGIESYDNPDELVYYTNINWDNQKLKQITFRDRDAIETPGYGGSYSEGQPHSYILYGNSIYLYPIPNSAKALIYRYIKEPAAIGSGSGSFSIPVAYTHFIADYALFRMYAKDQEADRAMFHKKLWDENIQMASDINGLKNKMDRYRVVNVEESYPQTDLGMI